MANVEDKKYLKCAIELAKDSMEKGGFPAGALIVKDNIIISEEISIGNILHDPTSHAETAAIRDACKKLATTNLEGATLYESMQCCVMCFSVANWAGVTRIVSACRKTDEMVEKGYYEGITSVQELNQLYTSKIELDYILDFEQEVHEIFEQWEAKINSVLQLWMPYNTIC